MDSGPAPAPATAEAARIGCRATTARKPRAPLSRVKKRRCLREALVACRRSRRGRGRPPVRHPHPRRVAGRRGGTQGGDEPEIAEALDLGPNTVKTQVSRARSAEGQPSRTRRARGCRRGPPAPRAGGARPPRRRARQRSSRAGAPRGGAKDGEASSSWPRSDSGACRCRLRAWRRSVRVQAATPSPAATLSQGGLRAGAAPLGPGDQIRCCILPYPSVYLQARRPGGSMPRPWCTGHDTALGPRRRSRVYEIRGASSSAFLPSDGPRPLRWRLTRPTDAARGVRAPLLLRLDRVERACSDVLNSVRSGRCLGFPVGASAFGRSDAIRVEGLRRREDREAVAVPSGATGLRFRHAGLTFRQVEARRSTPGRRTERSIIVARRTRWSFAGASAGRQVHRPGSRDELWTHARASWASIAADIYALMGRLLATYASARPGSPRHGFIVALGSGTDIPIAVDITPPGPTSCLRTDPGLAPARRAGHREQGLVAVPASGRVVPLLEIPKSAAAGPYPRSVLSARRRPGPCSLRRGRADSNCSRAGSDGDHG